MVFAAALSSAVVHGGACASPDEVAEEKVDPDLADVVLEGSATSPALTALLDADPIAGEARGPTITNPPADSVISAATIFTFEWTPEGTTATRARPADSLSPRLEKRAGAPPSLLPEDLPAAPAWLTALVGPIRTAHAHGEGAEMAGRGYFLQFSTPESPRLLRVFTTHESYTPDEKAWEKLRAAGEWTKLIVVSATFFDNHMVPATGPFLGTPVEFCIEE